MRICNQHLFESWLRVRVNDIVTVKDLYKVNIIKIAISIHEQFVDSHNGSIDDNNKIYQQARVLLQHENIQLQKTALTILQKSQRCTGFDTIETKSAAIKW